VFDDVGAGDSLGLHDRGNAREQFGVGEESDGGHENALSCDFSGSPLTRGARFDAAMSRKALGAPRANKSARSAIVKALPAATGDRCDVFASELVNGNRCLRAFFTKILSPSCRHRLKCT
jgi:hypothetical protein